MSKPHAPVAPKAFWIRHAVEGKSISGVTVQTRIASSWSAARPRWLRAIRAASIAMSDVATFGAAMWRSRMPVRSTIQASFVATICDKSKFVKTFGGTKQPSAVIFAVGKKILGVAFGLPLSGNPCKS